MSAFPSGACLVFSFGLRGGSQGFSLRFDMVCCGCTTPKGIVPLGRQNPAGSEMRKFSAAPCYSCLRVQPPRRIDSIEKTK